MPGSKCQVNIQACSFPDFLWFITQQILSATTHLVLDDYTHRRTEGRTIFITTLSRGQLCVTSLRSSN